MRKWYLPRGEVWQQKRYSRFRNPIDNLVCIPDPTSSGSYQLQLESAQLICDMHESNFFLVQRRGAKSSNDEYSVTLRGNKFVIDSSLVRELLRFGLLEERGVQVYLSSKGRDVAWIILKGEQ